MTEWPEVRLSNIASRVAQKNDVGIKRVLTVSAANGLVDQETYFTKKIASRDLTNYWVVEPGDLVYNKSTSKDAPFGVVARHYADEPALVTSLYIVLRADVAKVVPEYLKLACNGACDCKSSSVPNLSSAVARAAAHRGRHVRRGRPN